MYSIQYSGALCPGVPKVKFPIGRPALKAPAPDFIGPQPVNTTDELLATFAAVGFSPAELVIARSMHLAILRT